MKTKLFVGLLGLLIVAAGCVDTVTGRKTAAVPFKKDSVAGYYQHPLDQVFAAVIKTIEFNGTLDNEGVLHNQTNLVKIAEGRVNARRVWVRVQATDPKLTYVEVQTRTKGGGTDLDLAHDLEKQIALRLH
jgi:hypothetical protein